MTSQLCHLRSLPTLNASCLTRASNYLLLALLPCYSIILTMLLFDPCLLGLFWAYYMLFLCLILVAQYYHWASIHTILGFLDPFHCLQASLAHLILLSILGPFSFPGHPRPIPILYSHGPLLNLLGFPGPNYHIIYFWSSWAFYQPLTHLIYYFGPLWPILAYFLFHIMPMGLLFLFSELL